MTRGPADGHQQPPAGQAADGGVGGRHGRRRAGRRGQPLRDHLPHLARPPPDLGEHRVRQPVGELPLAVVQLR
ncbi:hypothetical protein [Streptomyces sp. NPDC048516]|uniref:hypothetical protein n=1 Tax=Streptomyces sp. NPDC048516 TaxID=3365565 RepID=UPI0037179A85